MLALLRSKLLPSHAAGAAVMSCCRTRGCSGMAEARANQAASRSALERKQIGALTALTEGAVRKVFGSNSHVEVAGSMGKHTDVTARSDLDLMIRTETPITEVDKANLVKELRRTRFGFGCQVQNCSYSILLRFQATKAPLKKMDLVPHTATFLPTGAKPLPTDRFKDNPKARHAVRLAKDHALQFGLKWPGNKIELAVLEVQRRQKNQSIDGLLEQALQLLKGEARPTQKSGARVVHRRAALDRAHIYSEAHVKGPFYSEVDNDDSMEDWDGPTGIGLSRTGPFALELAQVPELRHLRVAESSQSHTIFVNPGTYYMTPIWYRFDVDRGAWTHWTPYAFAGELHDTFWMPMGTDTVQTGFWKDDKPMRENLEIIECLRRRNQRIGP